MYDGGTAADSERGQTPEQNNVEVIVPAAAGRGVEEPGLTSHGRRGTHHRVDRVARTGQRQISIGAK